MKHFDNLLLFSYKCVLYNFFSHAFELVQACRSLPVPFSQQKIDLGAENSPLCCQERLVCRFFDII